EDEQQLRLGDVENERLLERLKEVIKGQERVRAGTQTEKTNGRRVMNEFFYERAAWPGQRLFFQNDFELFSEQTPEGNSKTWDFRKRLEDREELLGLDRPSLRRLREDGELNLLMESAPDAARVVKASGRYSGLAFSPDGRVLTSGSGPMSGVRVWDATTG